MEEDGEEGEDIVREVVFEEAEMVVGEVSTKKLDKIGLQDATWLNPNAPDCHSRSLHIKQRALD